MIIDGSSIIPAVAFIPNLTFIIFGMSRNKKERPNRSFMLYIFLLTVWSFGSMMMHANTGIATPLFWNHVMLVGLLGVPIAMFRSVLDMIGGNRRLHAYMINGGIVLYGFLQILNFGGLIVTDAGFEGTVFTYSLGKGALIAYPACYSFLIFGIVELVKELVSRKNDRLKRYLRVPLFGTIIMVSGVLLNLYEPVGRYPVDLFASSVHAVCIFYAVYRFKLIRYSSFMIRVIMYFLLISLSIIAFIGVIRLTFLSVGRIPLDYSILPPLLLGLVAAIIFQPFRLGTQLILERLYYGKRLAYYGRLRSFLESISSIVEPERLAASMADLMVDSFETEWAGMIFIDYITKTQTLAAERNIPASVEPPGEAMPFRKHPALKRMIAESNEVVYIPKLDETIEFETQSGPRAFHPGLILLLRFRDRLNGMVLLGKRVDREYYDRFDTEMLDLLARQCAITLENAISIERLKHQQTTLQELNSELIVSRNKYQAFFDGIMTPISVQNIEHTIIAVNIAATNQFRKSFQDLIGRKCYDAFFGRSKPCDACMAQDCCHSRIPFGSELEEPAGGTVFDVNFYPIESPPGTETLFIESFRDVTQQRQLQEDLEHTERYALLGSLASGIANAMKDPLADIVGAASALMSGTHPDSACPDYPARILERAYEANEVLVDISRYTNRVRTERIDPLEILESSLKLVGRGIDLSGIPVMKQFPDRPLIEADPNEFQQVIMNIIVTAVHDLCDGGELRLACRDHGWYVSITVSGTRVPGKSGMPTEPASRSRSGTGIRSDLGTSRRIVHRMGGRLDEAIRQGEESEIVVSLPVTKEAGSRIRYVHAKTPREIGDVFFLQRKVLVGEKGYIEESIRKDANRDSYRFLAYRGLHPIGTVTSTIAEPFQGSLTMERYFDLQAYREGKTCAEIERLLVLKEYRTSLVPLGLMVTAYVYARYRNAESVFIDVFSDEEGLLAMYGKLGFSKIGTYSSPLPVTVMNVDSVTDYERVEERMERFVRPFMKRLEPRLDFDEDEKAMFRESMRRITRSHAAVPSEAS